MPGAGNFHFVRSTKVRRSEVITLNGKSIWDGCDVTFSRIDALCGEGASCIFAEPNVKNQNDGDVINVAWFGSHDDDAKELAAIDRAKLVRVEDELVRRLEALRPAIADPEIGETVSAMLNLYDHNSIVAVGEHAVITDWGVLPHNATTSPSAYARHSDALIGRFLKSDMSPRLPGKTWTAHGGVETTSHTPQARATASSVSAASAFAAAAVAPAAVSTASRWWVPLALVLFFGALLIYVAWPGNLIYEKEAVVEQGALAQLETTNQTALQNIAALRAELNKDACEIDPTLVGLSARAAPAISAKAKGNPASTEGANGQGEQE